MECPRIDRNFTPDPSFNRAWNYKTDFGGREDYVFYDHYDGQGGVVRVQYCQLIGRKRDVFQCMNESEWRQCPYYLGRASGRKGSSGEDHGAAAG